MGTCLFCNQTMTEKPTPSRVCNFIEYHCERCGQILLEKLTASDFAGEKFTDQDKLAISITLRNNSELSRRKNVLNLTDLHQIVNQFRPLSPLEKMDHALIQFERMSRYVGAEVKLNSSTSYPLFYCNGPGELQSIRKLVAENGFIREITGEIIAITAQGYQRLREIQRPNRMSHQCFVAMWFTTEMNNVYEKAIKTAIEYKETGETESRYRAVKIDNVEHINDINDEIIAQIRRSRFVVCDLTGYRGGVYFEAGFAYGLGLDVIYTCRKDWSKEEVLKDNSGKKVEVLFDSNRREIPVKKEGVHFDLAHRNRIEWEPDKLDEFRVKLEARIKSLFFD